MPVTSFCAGKTTAHDWCSLIEQGQITSRRHSMPGACRLSDKANCPADGHGCTACPHNVTGPVVQGSFDTIINGQPAGRRGDRGIHGFCCGPNTYAISAGAPTVSINGKPAARLDDSTSHCGGSGKIESGSNDAMIGNSQTSGFKNAARNHGPFVCNCDQ
jgi:uncharacterized Zn-binding protein involved in type VI secretion